MPRSNSSTASSHSWRSEASASLTFRFESSSNRNARRDVALKFESMKKHLKMPRFFIAVILFGQALIGWAQAPSLALAPVSPEQLEGQERLGEALTNILLVSLSSDDRWRMVERGDVSVMTGEWSIGMAGLSESSNAVNQGRLLNADWMLVCRPEMRDVAHPTASCEVIDTVRAERLAVVVVPLANRPHGRWFRSPPDNDVQTLVTASQKALTEALVVRKNRADAKVVAPLFFFGDSGELEAAFAEKLNKANGGWRVLEPLRPDVARAEGLLRAAGFVSGAKGPELGKIADAYVWGLVTSGEGEGGAKTFKYSIWQGTALPIEKELSGTTAEIAEALTREITGLPNAQWRDVGATQLKIAGQLVKEVKAQNLKTVADYQLARRLLETAVFFAPMDREIQETRLSLILGPGREKLKPQSDEVVRLQLEYAHLADAFWRGAGNNLDSRLLAASFNAQARDIPGQRERAFLAAPFLVQAPLAKLMQHKPLFGEWLFYCRQNPENGQKLLETIWSTATLVIPEGLNTRIIGENMAAVGTIRMIQEDRFIDQARFAQLIDGKLAGVPKPVTDVRQARYEIVDSAEPAFALPRTRVTATDSSSASPSAQLTERQRIAPNPKGFFKLLKDYEDAREWMESRSASRIESEKRRAARIEAKPVNATPPRPPSKAMIEARERANARMLEFDRKPVTDALDRLRAFAEASVKNGTTEADGLNQGQVDRSTPLSIAVASGWYDVVEILIAAGADPTDGLIDQRSIQDVAAKDPVMMRALGGVKQGTADATAVTTMDGAAVLALLEKGDLNALRDLQLSTELLEYRDPRQWTLLHHAISGGKEDFALRLIAAGAPIEAVTVGGQTPLAFAAFRARPVLVKALLAKGAKANGRSSEIATPPLMGACAGGDESIVKLLLAAGADVNATENGGVPIIVNASRNSANYLTVKALVEAGCRLDVSDDSGIGPLEAALILDRVKTLQYLLDHGGKWMRAKSDPSSSPLLMAANKGAVECVQLLIERGERDERALQLTSNPAIRAMLEDKMQVTKAGAQALDDQVLWPAILSDAAKWKERVDAHLAAGGRVNFRSAAWTPLTLAMSTGDIERVRYLLAKGADPKVHPLAQHLQDRNCLDIYSYTEVREPGIPPLNYPEKRTHLIRLIPILVPLESPDVYESTLGTAIGWKDWDVAAAYVKLGVPTDFSIQYLKEIKNFTEADRQRALEILNAKSK